MKFIQGALIGMLAMGPDKGAEIATVAVMGLQS
jgi:hypothetical protein